jgi:TolB-like protein
VAAALAYAHARGVVHRDIKPENVLLHEGEPIVTDFGIGRAVTAASTERLTETGGAMGTPAYMSPEQAGAAPDLDGRSDQCSLACMLYEMLAGEPPFTGPSAQAIMLKHFAEPPPSARTAVAQAAGSAAPAGGTSIAVPPFVNMSADPENEYFTDGIAEAIINALTRVQALRVASRTSAFAFKGKNEDIGEIGRKLKVATVLEGSVRKAGNRLRVTAQLVSRPAHCGRVVSLIVVSLRVRSLGWAWPGPGCRPAAVLSAGS